MAVRNNNGDVITPAEKRANIERARAHHVMPQQRRQAAYDKLCSEVARLEAIGDYRDSFKIQVKKGEIRDLEAKGCR